MSDHDPNWDLDKVHPATRDLVEAMACDDWPSPHTMMAFDLATQEHYEAIYCGLRNGEITPAALNDAFLDGPRLTELVRSTPSNPHKGITFESERDWMPFPERDWITAGDHPKTEATPDVPARNRGRDIDRDR